MVFPQVCGAFYKVRRESETLVESMHRCLCVLLRALGRQIVVYVPILQRNVACKM